MVLFLRETFFLETSKTVQTMLCNIKCKVMWSRTDTAQIKHNLSPDLVATDWFYVWDEFLPDQLWCSFRWWMTPDYSPKWCFDFWSCSLSSSTAPHGYCEKINYKWEYACLNIIGVAFYMLWLKLPSCKTELRCKTNTIFIIYLSSIHLWLHFFSSLLSVHSRK